MRKEYNGRMYKKREGEIFSDGLSSCLVLFSSITSSQEGINGESNSIKEGNGGVGTQICESLSE